MWLELTLYITQIETQPIGNAYRKIKTKLHTNYLVSLVPLLETGGSQIVEYVTSQSHQLTLFSLPLPSPFLHSLLLPPVLGQLNSSPFLLSSFASFLEALMPPALQILEGCIYTQACQSLE